MSHGSRGKKKVDPLIDAYTCPACQSIKWSELALDVTKEMTIEALEEFVQWMETHPEDATLYSKHPLNAVKKWQAKHRA